APVSTERAALSLHDALPILQHTVRSVVAANFILDYASRLTLATHPENERAPQSVRENVRYGASPRGAQALVLGAKVVALLDGRRSEEHTSELQSRENLVCRL